MASIIALRPKSGGSSPKRASVTARVERSTSASGGLVERANGAAVAPGLPKRRALTAQRT